jgi:hypothetical protein
VIALVLKVCGDLALDEADRNKSADVGPAERRDSVNFPVAGGSLDEAARPRRRACQSFMVSSRRNPYPPNCALWLALQPDCNPLISAWSSMPLVAAPRSPDRAGKEGTGIRNTLGLQRHAPA